MTDKPYTDADLRAEAAKQHCTATEDPDFMGIAERMEGSKIPSADDLQWDQLGDHDFDTAQRGIDDLLTNAADVSVWAIALGADNLVPAAETLNPDVGVRIHFAFGADVPDDVRRAWIDGIHHAIREGL